MLSVCNTNVYACTLLQEMVRSCSLDRLDDRMERNSVHHTVSSSEDEDDPAIVSPSASGKQCWLGELLTLMTITKWCSNVGVAMLMTPYRTS